MAVVVGCKCGRQFSVKDEYAGRKGRCPTCGKQLTVPTARAEQRAPVVVATPQIRRNCGVDHKPPTAGQTAANHSARQRPCPSCGKFISTSACICEYCDAPLHKSCKGPDTPSPAHAFRPSGGSDELNGFDWLVSLLCPVIGLLIGGVRLARGNSIGGKMVGLSLVASAIYTGLCFMAASANAW